MIVAALEAEDEHDAVALWHEVGLTRPWNDPHADFARALAGPASAVLGTRDADGALTGTVMVGEDGHRGWLYYLAVAQMHRRTGLGRGLVRAAEAWLAERGVAKVQLMIRPENASALSFYEALGFERSEVAVMSRWLTP